LLSAHDTPVEVASKVANTTTVSPGIEKVPETVPEVPALDTELLPPLIYKRPGDAGIIILSYPWVGALLAAIPAAIYAAIHDS